MFLLTTQGGTGCLFALLFSGNGAILSGTICISIIISPGHGSDEATIKICQKWRNAQHEINLENNFSFSIPKGPKMPKSLRKWFRHRMKWLGHLARAIDSNRQLLVQRALGSLLRFQLPSDRSTIFQTNQFSSLALIYEVERAQATRIFPWWWKLNFPAQIVWGCN